MQKPLSMMVCVLVLPMGCSESSKPSNDGQAIEGPKSNKDSGGSDAEADDDASVKKDSLAPGKSRVFVTSRMFQGADLKSAGAGADGLQGGDKLCADVAQAAGLGGDWKAWLSTETVDAADRISDVSPWHQVDGQKAFADKAGLEASPLAGLFLDEAGRWLPSKRIWTGTLLGGTVSTGETCNDWTSSAMIDLGRIGQVGSKGGSHVWTAFSSTTCDQKAHLICFEQ